MTQEIIELAREAGFAMENSAAMLAAKNLHDLAIAAEHKRLLAGSGEPTKYEFQDLHDGTWHPFLSEDHYRNTVEDGRWPIRALYTADQIAAAVLRATLAAREACAAECDKVLGENAISAAIRGMQ